MGRLIYAMSVSLDGFVETADRSLDWVRVDDEFHGVFNDMAREMSAFLYGRRMYELMSAYWPTAESDPSATSVEVEFARIWTTKPKIVFSRTLDDVGWNSRLVRDGAIEEVARLKAQPGFDMGVGGPTTAATFIRAGLVDEFRLALHPLVLGGGTPFFPPLAGPLELRLLEARTFQSGVVYLRYETVRPAV
jgi:dihydrofolate reductase